MELVDGFPPHKGGDHVAGRGEIVGMDDVRERLGEQVLVRAPKLP